MKVFRCVTCSVLLGGDGLSRVILYVKTVKTVTGTFQGWRVKGFARGRRLETETKPKYKFVLSEDQQKIVDMVREAAFQHDLEVDVIDVARENPLHRVFQREFDKIEAFPTLSTDSGETLMAGFTKQRIEDFLSKAEKSEGMPI
jgi:hypothetical protein